MILTVTMNPPQQQERLTQDTSKVADKLDFHVGPWQRVSYTLVALVKYFSLNYVALF